MGYGPTVFCVLVLLISLGCDAERSGTQHVENSAEFVLVVKNIEPKLILNGESISLHDSKTITEGTLIQKWLKFFPEEANKGNEQIAVGFSARASVELKRREQRIRGIDLDEDLSMWRDFGGPTHFTDDSFRAFFAEQMKSSP